MLKGISKAESSEYISQSDEFRTESDGATVFLLGALDVNLKTHIQDLAMSFSSEGTIQNRTNFKLAEAARFGIRGWRMFKDDKGNDIVPVFTRRAVAGKVYDYLDDASAGALPYMVLQEIGGQVLRINSMTGGQGFTTP